MKIKTFLWGSGAKNCSAKKWSALKEGGRKGRKETNGGFQNPVVCPPPPPSFVFGSRPIFRAGKTPNIPFLVFLCSQTPRKRLLRRLSKYQFKFHFTWILIALSLRFSTIPAWPTTRVFLHL